MARIEINLLPRELRAKSRGFTFDKSLTLVVAFIGILVVLIVGIGVFQGIKLKALDKKVAEAQRRTDELKKNIELVDALTELKDKVLQRISAIEALDRNRAIWVRVLEDLSRRVPDYLWLSLLREEGSKNKATPDTGTDNIIQSARLESLVKRITMEGYSYSLNNLASFLIQLKRSPFFKNMELQYIKRAEIREYKAFSFQLVGDLHYVPGFENPDADTTALKLALGNEKKELKMSFAIQGE